MKHISLLALLIAAPILAGAPHVLAQALPQNAQLVSGAATVAQDGANHTVITQASPAAILNWQSFSIGKEGRVDIVQPGANAVLLNRVTGTATSTIAGSLTANGQVFLVNPNGIAIDRTGRVQAAGFVASTLGISDDDFLAGRLDFKTSGGAAGVTHAGQIRIASGGYAALLGGSVDDSGEIVAPMGRVAIGAGTAATLDLSGDGFLQVAMSDAAGNAAGAAVLTADDARDLVRGTVNMDEVTAATVASGQDGHVVLSGRIDTSNAGGRGGDVAVKGGAVDVTRAVIVATGATGGRVETSGDTLRFAGASVFGGTWLIDPTDLTVDAAAAATISSSLATTDVTLQTTASGASGPGNTSSGAGDILVNSAVSWDSSHQLTLDAYHGIGILAPITVAGAGKVSLVTNHGGSGGDFGFGQTNTGFNGGLTFTGTPNSGQALNINGQDYTLVYTMDQLDAVDGLNAVDGSGTAVYGPGLTGNYALASDLNAAGTTYGQALIGGHNGADSSHQFSGGLEGLGHTLSNLTISDPNSIQVGLISVVTLNPATSGRARIGDLALVNETVTGKAYTGGLIGTDSTDATPTVDITNVSVSANVTAGNLVISGDHASPYANAGIVAGDVGGYLSHVIAHGAVFGDGTDVGGILGSMPRGVLSQSSSDAAVTSSGIWVGGLVGDIFLSATIQNSHAGGPVTGWYNVGGLIGAGDTGTNVINSYATGMVTRYAGTPSGATAGGGQITSGLIGFTAGAVSNSYWDTQTSGLPTSGGGTGQTTAQLQGALPSGFDANIWGTGPGLYPYLKWQYPNGIQAITGTASTANGAGVAAGASLNFYKAGRQLNAAPIHGGANGYYYFPVPANTVAGATPIGTTMTLANATGVSGIELIDVQDIHGAVVNNRSILADRIYGWVSRPTWSATYSEMEATFGAGLFAALRATAPYSHVDLYSLAPTFTVDWAQDVTNVFKITEANHAGVLVDNAAITAEPGATVMFISNGPLTIDVPINVRGASLVDLRYDYYQVQYGGFVDPSAFNFANGAWITYQTPSGGVATSSWGGLLKINDIPYTLVYSMAQLDAIDGINAVNGNALSVFGPGLSGNYALARDLDASGVTYTRAVIGNTDGPLIQSTSSGWQNPGKFFSGMFDGLGHWIGNLTISAAGKSGVGLFGVTRYNATRHGAAVLRDLNLPSEYVLGDFAVGGLVGANYEAATGTFSEPDLVVANVQESGSINAGYAVYPNGIANYSYAGGIAGNVQSASLYNVNTTGTVMGQGAGVGGVVGGFGRGAITHSFSTANVSAHGPLTTYFTGGLVGWTYLGTDINNSYALGSVSGDSHVGGLVGQLESNDTVETSYAAGAVTGTANTGGLIGLSIGTTSNSYWDIEASGQGASAGGTGLTTYQLRTSGALPVGFNPAIWSVAPGRYPRLKPLAGQ